MRTSKSRAAVNYDLHTTFQLKTQQTDEYLFIYTCLQSNFNENFQMISLGVFLPKIKLWTTIVWFCSHFQSDQIREARPYSVPGWWRMLWRRDFQKLTKSILFSSKGLFKKYIINVFLAALQVSLEAKGRFWMSFLTLHIEDWKNRLRRSFPKME